MVYGKSRNCAYCELPKQMILPLPIFVPTGDYGCNQPGSFGQSPQNVKQVPVQNDTFHQRYPRKIYLPNSSLSYVG